jgi:hypothetical protein
VDLVAGLHLGAGIDAVLGEQRHVLVGEVIRQRFRRRAQVQQTAAFGLRQPGVVIAVAVEYNALVVGNSLLYKLVQSLFKVSRALKLIGKLL